MTDQSRAAVAEAAAGRIDAWLRDNAPTARAALRPPASEADLAVAEEALGRPVPADLRVWWGFADGAYPGLEVDGGPLIPPSYFPYSIADALKSRRMWMDTARRIAPIPAAELDAFLAADSSRPAGTPCETWLPPWLPIAGDRAGGDLFVDVRGGRLHGCVMEYRRDAGALAEPAWFDVAAMLYDIAERLAEDEADIDDIGRLRWSW